jgi:hypothetical protein
MYFKTGLPWSGVEAMLYKEIRNEVITAVIVNKLTWSPYNGMEKGRFRIESYCRRRV